MSDVRKLASFEMPHEMEAMSRVFVERILAELGHVKAPPVQQELPMQRAIPAPPRPKPERHTQEQRKTALRLFSEGHSDSTIAQRMRLTSGMAARGILLVVKHESPSIYWRAYERHMAARGIVR